MNEENSPNQATAPQEQPQPAPPSPTNQLPLTDASSTQDLPGAFSLFRPSVQALMINIWVVILLAIIPAILIVIGAAGNLAAANTAGIEFYAGVNTSMIIVTLLALVLMILIAPANAYVHLKSAKGIKVSFSEAIKNGLRYVFRFIGLSIILGLIITIGFILIIIPGIIMLRRYYMSFYYMVDEDLGIKEAMQRSAESTKPYSWKIYDIFGVNILFSLLGIVPILGQIVGAILQFLYSFAPAVRYYQIKEAYYGSQTDLGDVSSQAPLPPTTQPPIPSSPTAPAA